MVTIEDKIPTSITSITTTDSAKEQQNKQQRKKKQQDQLIEEAGKAAYHATITKSALSTTVSTAQMNTTARGRGRKELI
jgi:pyrrolidone-carboxylate peptidase